MTSVDDLHPDAAWCSSHRQETMKSTGLKVEAESQDLRNAEAMVSDPEELVLELDLWNAPKDPPPEHTNALWNYVSPEAAQARAESKGAKKKDAAQKKAAKAALKKASNPPKKKKAAKSTAPKKGLRLPRRPGVPCPSSLASPRITLLLAT
jgi:hypothetical protein